MRRVLNMVRSRNAMRLALRTLLVLALLAALLLLGRLAGAYIEDFRDTIEGLGWAAPLVFVIAYALAVVIAAPASLLTIAAGAVFGVLQGAVTVYIGAVLGSSAAFLVARYLARDAVARRIRKNQGFAAIDRAVGEQGLKIVFLLRLSPVFPFNLLNYALGLTRVSLADYLVGALGMIPGTFLYVYIGSLSADVAAASAADEVAIGKLILQGVGVLATLVVTLLVANIARRALREAGAAGEGEPRADENPAAGSENPEASDENPAA